MDIKELTTKKGKWSKAQKEYLIAESAKYGIEPPTNTGCPDCWRDMAIQVYVAMTPKAKGVRLRGAAATDGVIFKGRLILNPLDAETLQWMRDNGFPEQLLEGQDDED